MKMKDKEVAVIEPQANAVATIQERMADAGINAKDLAIPRLLLMQPTSDLVGDDKAKVGDVVSSLTEEVLGGTDKPVEIIPMALYKTLVIEDVSQKPPKFMRQEPLTSSNEGLPFEDKENGVPIKRTTCFNFFCLLVSEIEADDAMPVVVRFKSTSLHSGRQLASHLFKRLALNQEPYSQTVSLGTKKEKKDTNTYAVYTIGRGRPVTEKELGAARLWFPSLDGMKAKVDALAEGMEEPKAPAKAPEVVSGGAEADMKW